jgi:hypothetical protein
MLQYIATILRHPSESPARLLLVHQLPPRPTNLRVKTWRRLQDLGAVALKNSVYALPHTDQNREDFEWMKSEIQTMGGEATVFTANSIDSYSNDDVVEAFRSARAPDYAALEQGAGRLAKAAGAGRTSVRPAAARRLRQLRDRLDHLDRIAFFKPENRDRAARAVAQIEALAARASRAPASRDASSRALDRKQFRRRVWVTRPRPGIDRMSSAWLIRRFIDPQARFTFAAKPPTRGNAIPFDMYGVEFGHSQHGCTFETLVARFGFASPPLDRIGHIIHDLDLKETRYAEPETPAFGPLVEGLRQIYANDRDLLDHGMGLFEALYRALGA